MISAETSDTRVRHDWSAREICRLYDLPITELFYRAQNARRRFQAPTKVLLRTLLSVRTGDHPEDCACCSQSAHYATGVSKEKLMRHARAAEGATAAKAQRFNWFCLNTPRRWGLWGAEFGQARVVGMGPVGFLKIAIVNLLVHPIANLKNLVGNALVRVIGTPLQNAAPALRAKNEHVLERVVVLERRAGLARSVGLRLHRREMSDEHLARYAARAAADAA